MATFSYVAFDRGGKRIEGSVEAADRRAALLAVEKMGQVPVNVTEQSPAKAVRATAWWKLAGGKERMKPHEVMLFTAELSDLLAAGMTLGNALNCLAGRSDSAEAIVAADLRDRIIRGESLSSAVRAHPDTFPPLYGNMLRAGEASGAISEVLLRLSEHYERTTAMRSRIIQALAYPVIVLVMGVGVVIFAMIKIVPQFMKVFESMNIALPLSTRILIGSSNFAQRYAIFIAIGVVLLGGLLGRYLQTPPGRRIFDRLKLRTPLIRGIIANSIFANFARTLQTLLSNGVTVVDALRITEETVGNVIIAEELRHARERVTDGTSISGPLAAGGIFPRVMIDLLAVGEQTGDMPSALNHIGRRFESELDRNIKLFTTAIEPILIVFVAGGVGFVAISILSAVFKVTSGLGQV